MLAKWLHLKRQLVTLRFDNNLTRQVDGETVAWKSMHLVKQLAYLRFGQNDRQQAIFKAVVEKNVGVTWRNDGAKAELVQRPWRMLARRSATKIFARQQD